jgi:hypothetical protein
VHGMGLAYLGMKQGLLLVVMWIQCLVISNGHVYLCA